MGAETRRSYRSALRERDFRLLLSAFLVDQVGGWSYNVVLIVYVYDRTGSPGWIAATTAAGWIPRIVFSTFAGVLADRYERVKVLFVSAVSSCVVMTALAVVVGLDGPVILTLLLAALTATLGTTHHPAAGALIPEVTEERNLTAANGLFAGLENLVVVVGPAIGGLLLLIGDPTWGIGLNAATFAVAALLLTRVRIRSRGDAEAAGSLSEEVVSGVRALRRQRLAVVLMGFCALDTAVYGASTVLYVPISERLGTGADGYSYLLAGAALGGVLVAGAVNRLSGSARLAPLIVTGMLMMALPFAATVLTRSPVVGFCLQVISGAGMVVVDVLAVTALQRDLPRDQLSRVFGVFETVVLSAALVSGLAVAGLLSLLEAVDVLLIVGLGFSALAVLGLPWVARADRAATDKVRRLAARVAVLEQLDLFASANRPTLERLADAAEEVVLPAGAVVIREGDPAEALWVLVEGQVEVTASDAGGAARHLRDLGSGTYFGEIGLTRGLPRTATVTTTASTTLWRIDATDFFAALQITGLSSTAMARSARWLTFSHPHLSTAGIDDSATRPAGAADG